MAKREEASEEDEVASAGEPSSGTRKKARPSARVQLHLADLRGKTEGLEGAALEAAIDAWVDKTIERHSKTAPAALRDELRRAMRVMLESDPVVSAVVRGMKTATR